MKIYFAGPLSSRAEKDFNQRLTDQLEKSGFEVFLPQRDGAENPDSPYGKMSKDKREQTIFNIDRDQILACDIFLIILDGRIPDDGACVELGMAYAQNYVGNKDRMLIGLFTDTFRSDSLNAMIRVPLDYIAETEDDLISFLKSNY